MRERILNAAVLGDGPAGVATYVAADRNHHTFGGYFENTALVGKGNRTTLGRGFLNEVQSHSNSTANDLLLPVSPSRIFSRVLQGESAAALRSAGESFVPLAQTIAPF